MRAMSFTVEPIGLVRTPFLRKSETPRQGVVAGDAEGSVELFPGRGFEDALADLDGWERIWLVFWFDRVNGFRPKVRPPRSNAKRGLFSTRAPHRPNPIGLTSVRLLGADGLVLRVQGVDLLDETPVLDIKPYVPYADAFPEASHGWLPGAADPVPRWEVRFSPACREQLAFLAGRGVQLEDALVTALRLGPTPHAYRRIRPLGGGRSEIAVQSWRAVFSTPRQRELLVESLCSGYPQKRGRGPREELAVHRDFRERFS